MGDGNLNLVFVVSDRSDPARALVAKQALPYLRVAGESWPLTRERMRFESQAMLLYNELCPGLVPRVYDYDEEMSLMVMEFLGSHEIMRKALVARRRFPRFVDHISTFLVSSLLGRRCRRTSSIPGSTSCKRTSSTPTRPLQPREQVEYLDWRWLLDRERVASIEDLICVVEETKGIQVPSES